MNYELTKNEFIKLKKEELDYINNIAKISSNKILSESEKINIHRLLNNYEIKLNGLLKKLWITFLKDDILVKEDLKNVIIEIDLDKNYLSSLNFFNEQQRKYILEDLGIDVETLKFKLTLYNLMRRREYWVIDLDTIQNNQKLIETPIYIFLGYYDSSEDCYGPCFGDPDNYIYGIYENISSRYGDKKEIPKRRMKEFEKDKIIIYSKRYVSSFEVRKIFEEELLKVKNTTLNDCVNQTKNRFEELNYKRSPEYKEKVLLDKINELYKKVRGEFIQKEILYSGNFLQILRETYKLPNKNTVSKEKNCKKW